MNSQDRVDEIGKLLIQVVGCKTELEAERLVGGASVGIMLRLGLPMSEAAGFLRAQIGYYAGFMSNEESNRVIKLFRTEHPIYGQTAGTPMESLLGGMALGRKMEDLGK